jgi:hypothetical protein
MGSVTVKRNIAVQVIVTEKFREELQAELREAAEATQQRIDQMEFRSRRVLADLQQTDLAQAMNARRQFEGEKRRQEAIKQELLDELEAAAKLELGSEYPRGTLEGTVELAEGEDLLEKLGGCQIVVKDGVVVEIRKP